MPDPDDLAARVAAIERTLTDGHALSDLPDGAELAESVDALEERVDRIERRLDDLDAATQALRGYVGNVRSVNRDVERRADAALAAVEGLTDDGPLRAPSGECVRATGHLSDDASPSDDTDDGPGADDEADTPDVVAESVLARVRESL